MITKLSTHALDLYRGCPAGGLRLRLFRFHGELTPELLLETETNADGRTALPLLDSATLKAGRYELIFDVGDYFARLHILTATPPFLGEVPIRFTISEVESSYHVPLLFSPWSYSTYKGS